MIIDERGTAAAAAGAPAGSLWKVLVGAVWQSGWTGPEFPNNTKGANGKIPDFNDFTTNCSASKSGACVFDLVADPTEHTDLSDSPQHADVLKRLMAEMESASKTVYSPDRGNVDHRACEVAMSAKGWGGFWGPWL